ncbi:MAG: hypothetical protein L0196_07765 [candidate division Zixibacteria bacterium]|nr:hypothetical protein [candidate division Zixibacteria bacterium]
MKRTTMLLGAGILLFCSMFTALAPSAALGAVPQLINFQGILKDGSGNPVPNASYSVAVRIYDEASGLNPALWSDTFSVNTTGGLFNVVLGSEQPLPASLFSNANLWVGVSVGADPEASPRTQLTSVPYSARVGTVDGATGGVISGDVSIQSDLAVAGAMNAKNMVLSGPGPVQTPLTIHASPLQTSPLMEIKNSSGATLVSCASDGIIATPAIQLTSFSPTISNFPAPVPIEIKTSKGSIYIGRDDGILQQISLDPAASVSKLTEWKNGAGAAVASIEPSGATTIEHELGHNLGLCKVPVGGGFNFLECTDALGNPVASIDASGNISSMGYLYNSGGINAGGDVIVGGNVGIGTGAAIPNSPLQVNGAISFHVVVTPTVCLEPHKLNANDCVLLVHNNFCVPCGVELPSAVGIKGRAYTIKHIGGTTPCAEPITPFGSETIDGNPSYSLQPLKYVSIISDGANWWIVANN